MSRVQKNLVIFSHGFGVGKDDRGLFTDIARVFSSAGAVMFDYNDVDEETGDMTVRPFSAQVGILREVIDRQRRTNPDAVIDLVGHSQGCRVVALAQPHGIRKTIFLAPPTDAGVGRTLARYRENPKAVIDLSGMSQLPRTDGSTTFVPASYWRERMEETSPIEAYNHLADLTELVIIKAAQDTVLGGTLFDGLNPRVRVIELQGDHDFTGSAREEVVEMMVKEIED